MTELVVAQTKVVEKTSMEDIELKLVSTVEEAMEFKRWLSTDHEVLGLDTETTGLDPHTKDAHVRLIQIGDHRTGWAIPARGWGGVALEALREYEGQIALHNAAFDIKWMWHDKDLKWRAPWNRIDDTMIMAQICNPLGSGALKTLGVRLIDRRIGHGEELLKEAFHKQGWSWDTVPVDFEPYWVYGALDPVITAHVWSYFRADLKYPRVYELEMAVRRVVSLMEENGSPIDVPYCEEKLAILNEYVARTKAWGLSEHGFSLTSTQQLVKWFTKLGAVIEETTASGAPSVNKYQLKKWVTDPPSPIIGGMAKLVLDLRRADKLAGTYFSNFLSMNADGVLHPSIKTLGARTGRMSMTNPALQTLPKDEATVRDAFIPREGHSLISCDYSQVEMRLMAHFSEDPSLIGAFLDADASGGDFFVSIGKDIYQDPNFSKDDKRRGLVKNTMYGKAYGAGKRKMAETAGVRYDLMSAVVDQIDLSYPGLKTFAGQVENIGFLREREEGEGFIVTPFGRRLPCDSGKVYALVNYLLQGHAAEVLKDALVRLEFSGYGEYMLLPVHDEVIFSIPDEHMKQAMHDIPEIMGVTDGSYRVPLLAEAEGPLARWGDKYREKTKGQLVETEMIT